MSALKAVPMSNRLMWVNIVVLTLWFSCVGPCAVKGRVNRLKESTVTAKTGGPNRVSWTGLLKRSPCCHHLKHVAFSTPK